MIQIAIFGFCGGQGDERGKLGEDALALRLAQRDQADGSGNQVRGEAVEEKRQEARERNFRFYCGQPDGDGIAARRVLPVQIAPVILAKAAPWRRLSRRRLAAVQKACCMASISSASSVR